ncbi:MAG: type II toxin-antitoxin system VapB family antitoxin [Pseudomonadales bacterium]
MTRRINVYLLFIHTHGDTVRTNIVIDDKLMADALKATGLQTKKEAVEQGLKLLVRQNKQQEIRRLRGKLKWEGSLDEMRGGK